MMMTQVVENVCFLKIYFYHLHILHFIIGTYVSNAIKSNATKFNTIIFNALKFNASKFKAKEITPIRTNNDEKRTIIRFKEKCGVSTQCQRQSDLKVNNYGN